MTGFDDYARSMLTRSGTDRLPGHLEASHGVEVAGSARRVPRRHLSHPRAEKRYRGRWSCRCAAPTGRTSAACWRPQPGQQYRRSSNPAPTRVRWRGPGGSADTRAKSRQFRPQDDRTVPQPQRTQRWPASSAANSSRSPSGPVLVRVPALPPVPGRNHPAFGYIGGRAHSCEWDRWDSGWMVEAEPL